MSLKTLLKCYFPLGILVLWGTATEAAVVSDYCVRVSATANDSPAAVTVNWPVDPNATAYAVYRKSVGASGWGTALVLNGTATSYADLNVQIGTTYEYRINKSASGYSGDGYVVAGIEVPLVESRGKVILLVDATYSSQLATELSRLQQDLVGDGWVVLRHDVARMAVDPADYSTPGIGTARLNEVAAVKALITADYNADPDNVKTVFIVGHIPVPYAGSLNPDGHSDHLGAWPCDAYYADLDGSWTDSTVTSTSGGSARIKNIPGDGKFDAGLGSARLPSLVELQIGRVDLYNLPAFSKNEQELLRQYLDKDHAFRHGNTLARRRGLIDDEFQLSTGEPFAASGWRSFASFFGADNTFTGDWLSTLSSQSYLWGYGCGGGTFTSASGVATTSQLASQDPRVVFTMLFGSYFGDWDTQNNLLRATLATPSYTLTSVWAGRPQWVFHHMGLGETVGFSAKINQNNLLYPQGQARLVHVALMGDPTLRMHVVGPASGLVTAADAGGVKLTWTASADSVLGYHVYRAPTAAGPFTRRNASLIADTSFTDPEVTTCVYMVRAVKLEVSGSGSYYNASQGIFQTYPPPNSAPTAVNDTVTRLRNTSLKIPEATLLANDTDPEDPLLLSSVAPTSSHGATVALEGGWILYDPPSGFNSTDTFTYTISDGQSHTATATVTVNVVGPDDGQTTNVLGIEDLGGGQWKIRFMGIPGTSYDVQTTATLSPANWQTVTTLTADSATGLYELLHTPAGPTAFFRSVKP